MCTALPCGPGREAAGPMAPAAPSRGLSKTERCPYPVPNTPAEGPPPPTGWGLPASRCEALGRGTPALGSQPPPASRPPSAPAASADQLDGPDQPAGCAGNQVSAQQRCHADPKKGGLGGPCPPTQFSVGGVGWHQAVPALGGRCWGIWVGPGG